MFGTRQQPQAMLRPAVLLLAAIIFAACTQEETVSQAGGGEQEAGMPQTQQTHQAEQVMQAQEAQPPVDSARGQFAKGQQEKAAEGQEIMHESAMAAINPTKGNKAKGTVAIQKEGDGTLALTVDLVGLEPGKHGFHVHEFGDCSAEDAASAGGHFAPEGHPHGGPDDEKRHAGDLGNITADENGEVHTIIKDKVLSLNGSDSIIGRAFVVHKSADDLTSQPAGDAGARIGCGIIKAESAA